MEYRYFLQKNRWWIRTLQTIKQYNCFRHWASRCVFPWISSQGTWETFTRWTKIKSRVWKYAEQEVIAQLSACVLSQIYNNCNVEKWTYDYITHYIESKEPEQVRKMIMRVFAMTGKVIKSIISAHEEKKEETTKKWKTKKTK